MVDRPDRSSSLFRRPFDPNDFIRDLPDLLAGPEPILESPAGRRLLIEDPTCRAGVVAIADLVTTLRGGSNRLTEWRRGSPPRVPKSVVIATEYLRNELHRVLIEVGVFESIASASESSERTLYVERAMGLERAREHVLALGTALDASAGEPSVEVVRALRLAKECVRGNDQRDYLRDAEASLHAAERLLPRNDLFEFARLMVLNHAHGNLDSQSWITLARTTDDSEIARHAWTAAAVVESDSGRPWRSLEIDRYAMRLSGPSFALCYNASIHCIASGELGSVDYQVEELRGALARLGSDSLRVVRQQVLKDAKLWRSLTRTRPGAVESMFQILGTFTFPTPTEVDS